MSNHSFDITIAEEYKSVELAILVWHFQYWIIRNKRLNRNFFEGRTWTYQTLQELAACFPYWSVDQVKRLINKAVELKILLKGNFNKSTFDRTIWYSFENEEKFGIWRIRQMDTANSENGDGEIATPIPDTLPYTLTNKEGEGASSVKPTPPSRKQKTASDNLHYCVDYEQFGEHVHLKPGEYNKLCEEKGKEIVDYYIEAINNYVANNGPYKDYAAAIRQWYLRDKRDGKLPKSQNLKTTSIPNADPEKNKKMCEVAEQKLSHKFSPTVFFQASPSHATLVNKNKDFEKNYSYDSYDLATLREILVRDLETCFPGATQILKGNQASQNFTQLVSNAVQKIKYAGVNS